MGSSLRLNSVAMILVEGEKATADEAMREHSTAFADAIAKRRASGYLEVSDADVEWYVATAAILAGRVAGPAAHKAFGTAIAQAHQLGIDRSAKKEDFERETDRVGADEITAQQEHERNIVRRETKKF